jgi:cytochrome b
MHRLRLYHALLVVLVLASYVSGEWGIVHVWVGYGVAAVIILRLVMALSGLPQLGLMRFYPHFTGMKLGNAVTHPAISRTLLLAIAGSLLAVVATGIALDRGRALGVAQTEIVSTAHADEKRERVERQERKRGGGLIEDAHEFFANFLMLIVAVHVAYLLAFKRPIALFMIFLEPRRDPAKH